MEGMIPLGVFTWQNEINTNAPFPGDPDEELFLKNATTLDELDDCELIEKTITCENLSRPCLYTLKLHDLRALDGRTYLTLGAINCAIGIILENQAEHEKERYLFHYFPKFEEANLVEQLRNHVAALKDEHQMPNIFEKDWFIIAYFHDNNPRLTVVQNPRGLLFVKPPKGSRGHGDSQGTAKIYNFYTDGMSTLQENIGKQMKRFLKICAEAYEPQMYLAVTRNTGEDTHAVYVEEIERPYELVWILQQIFSPEEFFEDTDPNMEVIADSYVLNYHEGITPHSNYGVQLREAVTGIIRNEVSLLGHFYLRARRQVLKKIKKRDPEEIKTPKYFSPFLRTVQHPSDDESDESD